MASQRAGEQKSKTTAAQPGRWLEWLTLVVGLGVLGVVGVLLLNQSRPTPIVIQPAPSATPLPPPTASPTPAPLIVYVNGAVRAPGLYTLPPGSRVAEALAAAGGLRPDAFGDGVNLAAPLSDGLQIFIATRSQADEQQLDTQLIQRSGVIALPTVPEVAADADGSATAPAASAGGKVNINTADSALLDTLPGIGPATAQKIIDYRETVGPFQTIEEILNVAGIGEAKFAAIRELITVEPPSND